jgi:predicted GTPase
LAAVADAIDAPRLAREARTLAMRVADGRFNVVCVGQFKRGKSTLLNALVEQEVLPAGIVPVTTVVTVMRHAAIACAEVRFATGENRSVTLDEIADYIAEERNPQNARGVEGVEIGLPHPILGDGLCLVDTLGMGSVFEGSSTTTHAFVPQMDAAILVSGVDPPLCGEELALAKRLTSQAGELIVVMNKADRHTERERSEAAAFANRILSARLGRTTDEIL